ncbi:CO/xanthine dehydrogenase FAD-binding subunit [Tamaricihabitans halophyticus]|uniref:CO/xanthine dehydrogenase FAD-binding subunit n=1 Tax=Tamaricihabitans halophyticus TaxID=1262583 RepID=A0A4V2SV34_9PSEU|nr:FAD binding domain-containing protein [Tamaricihabitans halophyticus]TCP56936.1 CO/xanthine dehydrogenase FAD-binding subunit [Tamaricihabitans halophyticus]
MEFYRPTSWREALEIRAAQPDALPITGGTDVMVELNFDRARPAALLDLTGVPEITGWSEREGQIQIGASMSYTAIIAELADRLPCLALAARTVGSPQIRNRGTAAGNLGAGSPAGDSHPPLLATGAKVHLESVRGSRELSIDQFYLGVKRTALEPDELIRSIEVPAARGPQQFAKIGTRNAMVIAVCSFAIALDAGSRTVGTGLGSAAPTPRQATDAQDFLAEALPWADRDPLAEELANRFGELVAAAAVPIDDVRGSARYRRHALAVLARRTLGWAWEEYRCA